MAFGINFITINTNIMTSEAMVLDMGHNWAKVELSTDTNLLNAGISVTAGLAKLVPKWIMGSGLALAASSLLSMFNMVFPQASVLLPIGRFLGMTRMVIAGFSIPRSLKN